MSLNEPSTSRKGSFESEEKSDGPINFFRSLLRQLSSSNSHLMLPQFENYIKFRLSHTPTEKMLSIHITSLVEHGIEHPKLAWFTKTWMKMFRECEGVKLKVLRVSLFTVLEDRYDAVCTSKEVSPSEIDNLLSYTFRLQKFLTVPFHKTLLMKLIDYMNNGRLQALKIFLTYIENLNLLNRLIAKRKLKWELLKNIQIFLRLQLMQGNHPIEINEQMARVINLLGSEEIFFNIKVNDESEDDEDDEEEELSEDQVFDEILSITKNLKFIDINYAFQFFNNFEILPNDKIDGFVRFYVDTALESREFKLYAEMAKKFDEINFSSNCNLNTKIRAMVINDYQTKCKNELFTNLEKFSHLVEFLGELYNAELASIDDVCEFFESFLNVIKSPLNLDLTQLLLKTISLQVIERNHAEKLKEIHEKINKLESHNLAGLLIIHHDITRTLEIIFNASAKNRKDIFQSFADTLKSLTTENFNKSLKEINFFKFDGNQTDLEILLKFFMEACFNFPNNLTNLTQFLANLNFITCQKSLAANQIQMTVLDHLTQQSIEGKNHETLMNLIMHFHALNLLNDSQIILFVQILLEQNSEVSVDGLFTILSSLGGHLNAHCKMEIFPKLAFIEFIAQSEDSYRAKVFKTISNLKQNNWGKMCDTKKDGTPENEHTQDALINSIWKQLMKFPETHANLTKSVSEIFNKKNQKFNENFWSFMELRRITFTKASVDENLPSSFSKKLYTTILFVINLFENGNCTENFLTDWIHPKLIAKLNSSQKIFIVSSLTSSSRCIKASRLKTYISSLESNLADSTSTFSEIMKNLKDL